MQRREAWLGTTMIELADTLVSDFDLTALLGTLARRCAELLEATEVGVVVADGQGVLHAMAASTERMYLLALFELQRGEGPCLDCIQSGEPVEATSLDDTALTRWVTFGPAAVAAGYRQVLALPMRHRDTTIGAVNVFLDHALPLPVADLQLARALADIATIGILQERATCESTLVAAQLQGALNSRIAIEQAKGMLAQHRRISADEAFVLLRAHARNHNLRLIDVARAVGNRQLALDRFGTAAPRRQDAQRRR